MTACLFKKHSNIIIFRLQYVNLARVSVMENSNIEYSCFKVLTFYCIELESRTFSKIIGSQTLLFDIHFNVIPSAVIEKKNSLQTDGSDKGSFFFF